MPLVVPMFNPEELPMWTISVTVDELAHFPIAEHCEYVMRYRPAEDLPELYSKEFDPTVVFDITIKEHACCGDYIAYAVQCAPSSLVRVVVWDKRHRVFWYCSPWSEGFSVSWTRDEGGLLSAGWWPALAAAWLYRTQLQALPKDLLSTLDRILGVPND